MNAQRKPRGDAKLKMLKPEMQAAIAERLASGTLESVRKWLKAEFMVVTSLGALSDFGSWYALSQRFKQAETYTGHLKELVVSQGGQFDAQEMAGTMNAIFLKLASKEGDFETFKSAFELVLKSRKADADERRLALLEKKAAKADAAEEAMKDGSLSMEQKHAKMKEVFGIAS